MEIPGCKVGQNAAADFVTHRLGPRGAAVIEQRQLEVVSREGEIPALVIVANHNIDLVYITKPICIMSTRHTGPVYLGLAYRLYTRR